MVERLSYDAWGKRRYPNGQDDPGNTITSSTSRGYIGQEEVADVGLVNLNSRVYDPFIARFTSPDKLVESPYNPQDWNRYSYVLDNPTSFSDPSGACFLGCFWKPIFKAISQLFRSIPFLGQIVGLAAAYFVCGIITFGACTVAAISITSAITTGIASGKLGLALRAGLLTAASMIAFNAVGDISGAMAGVSGHPDFSIANLTAGTNTSSAATFDEAFAFNIAGHAAIGCAMAVASHESCGSGALAGAIPDMAGPAIGELNLGFAGNLIASSVIGGTAAAAAGGNFANGAVTGAFGYLFNACGNGGCWTTSQERTLVNQGNFLGYYSTACEGGDLNACFDYGVASGENPGPDATLREDLLQNGYSFDETNTLVKTTIPLDLANDYANYLPQSEDQARFPVASDIAQYHWDEFAKFGLQSGTFGGTPFGSSGPIVTTGMWCPLCK